MFKALLDIIFPPLCHVCRAFITERTDLHICQSCRDHIIPLCSPFCTSCGLAFGTEDGIDHLCGTCIDHPPPFKLARAATTFEGPVREMIHRFKYGHRVQLRLPLALLITQQLTPLIREQKPDFILPVPLHRRRLRERGFNQALLLADTLSKKWKIPLSRHNLRRIRWTEPQINLSAAERATNVRGAFSVTDQGEFDRKKILLIDDVYTTGSTVRECAKVLRSAGAAEVFVVTVARAPIS